MSPLFNAIGLSLIGSFGGLLVASTLLLFRDGLREKLVPWLVSYAVGTLLGVALLALLPEALEAMHPRRVFESLLAGILLFFVLEKLVLWRHCHTNDCEVHGTAASLVLVGDAFHNFVDGAMIGAAVLTSLPLGVSTAIAVATHEVPQEVGDFAVLLHAGYSRRRALLLNVLSGVSALARRRACSAARGRGPNDETVPPLHRRRELPLHRDVGPHPGPAQRPDRGQRVPAARSCRRRCADGVLPVA